MFWVAVGGVIGSLFRYILNELFGSDKTGVLIANQIGVAVASYAVVYFLNQENINVKNFVILRVSRKNDTVGSNLLSFLIRLLLPKTPLVLGLTTTSWSRLGENLL